MNSDLNNEIIFVDITLNGCKNRLCVCYRAPNTNIENFNSYIEIIKINSDYAHQVCITSDFYLPSGN